MKQVKAGPFLLVWNGKTIGGVGVLLNSYAMKSLNIIEKIISNIKDYIKLKDNITLLPLTP